ncbi:CheR family methyltransferase [Microbacteriaceae bacterium 4G12]
MNERDYAVFIDQMKKSFRMDISAYKQERIKRRIDSFLTKNGFSNYSALLTAFYQDSHLLEAFIDHLTINVSEFYRNSNRWDILEKKIIPKIIEKNSGKLKIWSAACASGEESYTLSIILSRVLPKHRYEIHATDIDHRILQKAKQGMYQERSLNEVPIQIKNTYFLKEQDTYTIQPEIKQNVKFKQHDLLVQPYETGYDLIVCRNVTIYFTEAARNMVHQKFSQALRPGGFLFVGSTEQVLSPERYGLQMIEPFFYQKTEKRG